MSAPIVLSADNFDSEVTLAPGVILVDFWASWCAPCRAIAPLLDRLAEEFQDRVRIGKLDVDAAGELATGMGIMSIPTLILFSGGKEVKRLVGLQTYETLKTLLEAHTMSTS